MESAADRLKKVRAQAGFATGTDAARAMGIPAPTYLGHENGTTGLKRTVAIRYAKFFKVSLDWLLTGIGAAREVMVNIEGYVGAGAEVYPVDEQTRGGGLGPVRPPVGISDCVALRIRGDSMYPFLENWLVFYRRHQEGVPEDAAGKLVVAKIADGPTLLKILRRGSRKGRWTLESSNAAPREDVELEWAAKVIEIRPT